MLTCLRARAVDTPSKQNADKMCRPLNWIVRFRDSFVIRAENRASENHRADNRSNSLARWKTGRRLHEPGDDRAIIASYPLFTLSPVSILYSALERSSLLTSISIMRHLQRRVSKYIGATAIPVHFLLTFNSTQHVLETALFNNRFLGLFYF